MPVPVVVRSIVASCISTITLSLVMRGSISKNEGIIVSVFSNDSMQFSGNPVTMPPRWPLMTTGRSGE